MKRTFLAVSVTSIIACLAIPVSFATNLFDSAQIRPTNEEPVKKTYVLASGAYGLFCQDGHGSNCRIQVTNKLCPEGYTASASTSIVGGGAEHIVPMRSLYLAPQPAVPMAVEGGYLLGFIQAYSAGSGVGSYPLFINYTIYCG